MKLDRSYFDKKLRCFIWFRQISQRRKSINIMEKSGKKSWGLTFMTMVLGIMTQR
jgi:hypothetical protein